MPPNDLLHAVSIALPGLPRNWLPLLGGRTNRVWLAGDVVVKLYDPAAASPLFPNEIGAEIAALRQLAPFGLCPTLRASGENWLAYDHIPGHAWKDRAAQVAHLLGRLHQCGARPAGLRQLTSGSAALHQQTRQMARECGLTTPIPEVPEVGQITGRLIHGDAVAGNIISGAKGHFLIDWQCPAIGDPAEDLASFLSPAMQVIYRGHPLTKTEEGDFLHAYPDAETVARYQQLRPLFHLRMLAHCHWRAGRGDHGYAMAAAAERAALQDCADPDA